MSEPQARNPRVEATARLPVGFEGRVLEPSPPPSTDPLWFADDPTDPADSSGTVVTPIPGEGVAWAVMAEEHPGLAGFVSDNWLGESGRLRPLSAGYVRTRECLHQLAYFVLAPRRFDVTGRMGLRYTGRGFGSPFFGLDEQVRVEGSVLVQQRDGGVRWTALTTIGDARRFLGVPPDDLWYEGFRDPLDPLGGSTPLEVDDDSCLALGDWFGFATLVLERMRRTPGAEDVTRIQIWPEHFDAAVDIGSGRKGQRATYGASPGDAEHPEPYLYVTPRTPVDRGDPYWNADAFNGAHLPYRRLLDSPDPVAAALHFLEEGHRRLMMASRSG